MQKTTPLALEVANTGLTLAGASSERGLPLPMPSFADTRHLSRVMEGYIFVFKGEGFTVRRGKLSLGGLKKVHNNLFGVILTKLSSAKRTKAAEKIEILNFSIEKLDEKNLFLFRSQ